jgi:hypothetical protein
MDLKQERTSAGRLGLIIFLTLAGILYLGSRKKEIHAQNQLPQHVRVSAITDWSHRHIVYSKPSSIEQSLKLQSEPRYQLQLQKTNAMPQPGDAVTR